MLTTGVQFILILAGSCALWMLTEYFHQQLVSRVRRLSRPRTGALTTRITRVGLGHKDS